MGTVSKCRICNKLMRRYKDTLVQFDSTVCDDCNLKAEEQK